MKNIRLKKVLEFIEPNAYLADVGCDHGYLAIEAIKKGVTFVQLIDNKEKPLQNAINNILDFTKKNNLTFNVKYSLSSGLNMLDENIDTVSICGMGPELIVKILDENLSTAKKMNLLVLQPNKKTSFLRKYLFSNQFKIIDEAIVEDKNKIYEIIACKYVNHKIIYNKKDYIFGPILRKNQNEIFIKKWAEKLEFDKKILLEPILIDKKEELKEEIKLINEVLNESK